MRLLLIAALAVSCTPVGAPTADPGQRFALYQYVLEIPTKPVSPNEQLKLVWKGQLAAQPSSALFEMQLCAALFGPFGPLLSETRRQTSAVPEIKKNAIEQHANIISALTAGDIEQSRLAMEAHMQQTQRDLRQHILDGQA